MFSIGTNVRIQNLKSIPSLNGQIAQIIEDPSAQPNGRIAIEVNSKRIRVKTTCLQTMSGSSLDEISTAIQTLESGDDEQLRKVAIAFKSGKMNDAMSHSIEWTQNAPKE